MVTLTEAQQYFAPGKLVLLYQLDFTRLGGSIIYLTPNVVEGGSVSFDGQIYTPAAIEADGFEQSSRKANGRPTVRIGRTALLISLMLTYRDGIGGIFRRLKTLDRFLDGGADEDPTAIIDTQVWRISRKSKLNKVFVEWELASPLDQPAAMIPKGQAMKTHCRAIYRRYAPDDPDAALDGYVYDESTLACPYVGAGAFDLTDQPTDTESDRASKTLGCCRARFSQNAVLPFMAFPSIGDIR